MEAFLQQAGDGATSGGGLSIPGLGQEVSLVMYGGAVVVLLLFIGGLRLGWWHMDSEVKEIRAGRDRAEKERDQLRVENDDLRDQLGEWKLIARQSSVTTARSVKNQLAMMAHKAQEEGPVEGHHGSAA